MTGPWLKWTPSQSSRCESVPSGTLKSCLGLFKSQLALKRASFWLCFCIWCTDSESREIWVLKSIWIVFSAFTINKYNEDGHVYFLCFYIVWIIYKKNHVSIKVLKKTDYIFKLGIRDELIKGLFTKARVVYGEASRDNAAPRLSCMERPITILSPERTKAIERSVSKSRLLGAVTFGWGTSLPAEMVVGEYIPLATSDLLPGIPISQGSPSAELNRKLEE